MSKMKRYSLIFFLAVILITLLIGAIGYARNPVTVVYEGTDPQIELNDCAKGIYEVSVAYIENDYSMIQILSEAESAWGVRSNTALMPPYRNITRSYIYVGEKGDGFNVAITPIGEDSNLQIAGVTVTRKRTLSATYTALDFLLIMSVLYGIAILVLSLRQHDKSSEYKRIILGVTAVAIVASFGFLQSYIAGGHDAEFHIARIAAISRGLANGEFPVRIYQYFVNDYGYPLGVFYGDIFLYPSAVLHMLGMPLWKSYTLYVIMINVLTALIAYYSFARISGNGYTGFLACVLYTLSLWRINDVYVRAAVGEYTAMAFMPLLVLAFVKLIQSEDIGSQEGDLGKKITLWLVVGYTGVIQSHMLSSIMVTTFLIVVCIVYFRRVFVKTKVLLLLRSALWTVAVNLGFIVPMLNYYGIYDLTLEHQTDHIQVHGAYISQIIATYGNFTKGSVSLAESIGVNDEMPMGIGLTMLLILVVALSIAVCSKNRRIAKPVSLLSGITLVSLWMSTCYFPYDFIATYIHPLARVISRVQFPWRYLMIATLAISVSSIYIMQYMEEGHKKYYEVFYALIFVLTLYQSVNFISYRNAENDYYINAMNVDQIATPLIDNDTLYWFNGMSREVLENRNVYVSDDSLTVTVLYDNVPSYGMQVTNSSGADAFVEPPILGYKGYHAYSTAGELPVDESDTYRLRVTVPAGFDGAINIEFKEPVVWRICEIISLLSLVAVIVMTCMMHKAGIEVHPDNADTRMIAAEGAD